MYTAYTNTKKGIIYALILMFNISINSFTFTHLGLDIFKHKKSLSPVKMKSTSLDNAAFSIG